MSDQPNTTDTPNTTTDAPSAPKPRAKRVSLGGNISHQRAIALWAQAYPKDPSAKGLRTWLRSHKEADPAYRKHVANTPWCDHKRAVLHGAFVKNRPAFAKLVAKERPARSGK